jgi:SAM-dependent methyltransferase
LFLDVLSWVMSSPSTTSERQLTRQRSWLADSWTWLLKTRVLDPMGKGPRPTALDVGCGPGLVMELFSPIMDVQGLDIDPSAVRRCLERGQRAVEGRVEELPYADSSFDIVYCTYLLMWLPNPVAALREMVRVSRRWVLILAEPDHAGRITFPDKLTELDSCFPRALQGLGADPRMGRKLAGMLSVCGLRGEMGVHPGMWTIARPVKEARAEWESLVDVCGDDTMAALKPTWDAAARDGSLVQFTPTFYALARKT